MEIPPYPPDDDDIDRISADLDRTLAGQLQNMTAERDSLRTRVAELEALVEEACDIASLWIKTYTPGPSVTADRVAAIRAAAKEHGK